MNLNLNDKVALVVASSHGLGKAIAEQLANEGTRVMITSRDAEKLQIVQNELNNVNPDRVQYCAADITNYSDIKHLIRKTIDCFGKIDILVNNSGGPSHGTFEQFSDLEWENAFHLTLLSYIRLIREALPYLKQRGGRIINIASSSIKQPIPGLILSNTFRLGIVGLSKTLASELAKYNILVNTVAPGRIETNRVHELDQKNADREKVGRDEIARRSKMSIPLGRYGTPEEFANAVIFLASDASSYITGSSFFVDGGKITAI